MVAGSRKRRRPDDRLASPPLAPSPLLTRNLQLLPVGLTQLPNDVAFVSQLITDIDALLSTFSEACLLSFSGKPTKSGPATSQAQDAGPVPSPFSIFAHLWRRNGWHYAQFAFADHTDSKLALSNAICRALLRHLQPFVDDQTDEVDRAIAFTDLKQLFKTMAVPFALYTFWSTQLVLTSGIGVKHCRPAMPNIAIEQDYYDCMLDLPSAVLQHLQHEESTRQNAQAITADVVEVVCRLAGQDSEPVFDIIPSSEMATRLPRTWPSLRVMTSLEANKEFGRLGTLVRANLGNISGDHSTSTRAENSRETVVGLSRGDLIRLKARRRLAIATSDLSKLLPASPSTAASWTEPSQATAGSNSSAKARFEIRTPAWIKSARYTAKMKLWLEEVTTPMQAALERGEASRQRYGDARAKVMAGDGHGEEIDYGQWVLNEFRKERQEATANDEVTPSSAVTEAVALDAEESLTVEHLYRLAAERTKAAAVQRGERLSISRTRNKGSK